MKKHSARVAPLSACNSPVLTLTKVEGRQTSSLCVCLSWYRLQHPSDSFRARMNLRAEGEATREATKRATLAHL